MSDTVQIALIVAIPPTLAALGAVLIGLKNGTKADRVLVKADEIHSLTNSQLTAVTTDLRVANEKIAGMEKLLAEIAANKAVGNKTPPKATKAK